MKGKKLLTAFLLGVGLCFAPVLSIAREPRWDGYLWNELSSRAKYCYIVGYAEGIGKILGSVLISGTLSIGEERFESKDAFAMVKAIYELHARDYPGNFPEAPPIARAAEAMNNLYTDSENRVILMRDAIKVVCMKLRSDPEEDIGRTIEILREEAQGEGKEKGEQTPKPSLGHGEIKQWKETDISFYIDKYPDNAAKGLNEWREACDEQWKLELSLLDARVNYMMRNPSIYENITLYYDPDGRFNKEFPEGIETGGRIVVWIVDNREIYKTMSGVALLDLFKAQLEIIHTFLRGSVWDHIGADIVMNTDIVAKFHSREGIPLGYFYQGEYHLWEE